MIRRTHVAGATMLALAAVGLAPLSLTGVDAPAIATTRHAPGLFAAASAADQRATPDLSLGSAKRSRYVTFRAEVLPSRAAGQRISLAFFKGASFIGNVQHIDRQPMLTSWSGPLNSQYGTFVVTRSGDRYSVMASTTSGNYSMSMTRAGRYQVQEVQPPQFSGDDEVTPAAGPASGSPRSVAVERRHKKVRGGDDGSIEDILVLYTAQAAAAYGGVEGINAEAAKNIGYTNAAYAASGATTTARLVGVVPTATTEVGGDLSDDLHSLAQRGDGKFDEVFSAIKQLHADDTLLLDKPYSDSSPVCGLGNLVPDQPVKYAFAVVSTGDCTNAYPTFPHELGHNQGLAHDYYAVHDGGLGAGSKPEYPFGYGYVSPDCSFRTIMSYPDKCKVQIGQYVEPVFLFANPAVAYNGQPAGTADQSNTALAISKTAKVVARHQQSQLYPRGSKVAIKPAPRVGQRVHVVFKGWVNRGVHTKYRWYRDGQPIKRAKHAVYRPTRKDAGKQLSVVVKGKKKYYATVLVGSGSRKVKGNKHRHHRLSADAPTGVSLRPTVAVRPRIAGWV